MMNEGKRVVSWILVIGLMAFFGGLFFFATGNFLFLGWCLLITAAFFSTEIDKRKERSRLQKLGMINAQGKWIGKAGGRIDE